MIENIDFNPGRLMQFLKESDRDNDTIVIMLNDKGLRKDLMYNANMYCPKCSAWKAERGLFILAMAG